MKKKVKNIYLVCILFVFIFSINIRADSKNGILKGIVNDAENGIPLEGVNVILIGTKIGAATNEKGMYIIKSIPEGEYTLKASMVGYKTETRENVKILPGEVTTVNFELEESIFKSPDIIITASKKTQTFGDIPVSVDVLGGELLKEVEFFDVENALKYVSGVNMVSEQVNIRNHAGYRRGTGSTVILMLDGIPLLPGDTGDIKWDIIPIENIRKVEVVKGPASALYGSAALGGVINIITEEPEKRHKTSINLMGGFYDKPYYEEWEWSHKIRGFKGLNISHSMNLGKYKILLSAGHKSSDGYMQNGFYERYHLFSKFKYNISANEFINITGNYATQERGLFIQWLDRDNVLKTKERDIGNSVDSDKLQISFNYYKLFSDKFSLNVKGYNFKTTFTSNTQDGSDVSEADRGGIEVQSDVKFSKKHFISWGIETVFDNVNSDLFGKHSGLGSALYIQDEITLSNIFTLTAGGRFDYKKIDILKPEYQISPKVGITIKPKPGVSIWGSIGKGFRYPLVSEAFANAIVSGFRILPNEDIRSESCLSYEIGSTWKLENYIKMDCAVFLNRYKNMIEANPDSAGNLRFENLTKAEIKGMELSLSGSIIKNFFLKVDYSYTECIDLTLPEKVALAYRPDHILNIRGEYDFTSSKIGANFRYVSKTESYKVYPNDPRVPLYLVDCWWETKLAENIIFNAKINNLFQYNYSEIERNLYPIRNFTFSVRTAL